MVASVKCARARPNAGGRYRSTGSLSIICDFTTCLPVAIVRKPVRPASKFVRWTISQAPGSAQRISLALSACSGRRQRTENYKFIYRRKSIVAVHIAARNKCAIAYCRARGGGTSKTASYRDYYCSLTTVMLQAGKLSWTLLPTVPSDCATGAVQVPLRESSYCALP